MLEFLLQDFKLAFRLLLKNPGFSAVALLTLALGIGATTIVFTIVNGVLLQPLDYPHSDRIVNVWEGDFEEGFSYGYQDQTSPANFMDWRRENTVFESIALWANFAGQTTRSFIYTEGKEAYNLTGRFVSTHFFKVFGLSPLLGRSFLEEEEVPGAPRVVVISFRLWTQFFENDPEIIGKSMRLENNGRFSYEIIGVMPNGFRFGGSDVWVSIAHMPESVYRRGGNIMSVIGRLKEGVSIEKAKAAMNVIQWRIHDEFKGLEVYRAGWKIGPNVDLEPMLDSVVSHVRPSLVLFMGAVCLLLLIAVANVANLLLSRALTRKREMSVRAALGARRWQLVKQLLSESLVLSIVGGAAGIILAWLGLQLVLQFHAGAIPRATDIGIEFKVLVFTVIVSLVTAVLFGFAPALQTSKPDLNDALRQGANRLTSDRSHNLVRNSFTVIQVALAFTLLIGAGLLIQSFNRMQSIDTGYKADNLLTVMVTMTGAIYDGPEQRVAFLQQLIDEMKGTSGVEAASAVSVLPTGKGWPYPYTRSDLPAPMPKDRPRADLRSVTEDYHETYGIEVVRGRPFNRQDTWKSEPVVMVNETFDKTAFPEEDALGKHIRYFGKDWRIIGIYGDIKNVGLTKETNPGVNLPIAQWPGNDAKSVYLTLRTKADPLSLASVVSDKVRKLNPEQPLNQFQLMETYLDNSTAIDRFRSILIGLFAFAALVLASIGIYGVISYSVEQRTNEMGIRLALGAKRRSLLWMILRQGLKLTLGGVGLGVVGSWIFSRVIESQLYGVTASDLRTYIVVAVVLISVGVVACIVPAMRAMRVSPMESLRAE
jgi:putative ABC transport system permease protein